MTTPETVRAIEAVWRIESPKIIGSLTRLVRDLSLAEDLAHDALVAALEQWPLEGTPRNPAAWLMATARRRGIDLLRRRTRITRKHEELGRDPDQSPGAVVPDLAAALDDDIRDDVLRLIFTACHPVLSTDARVALTLRLLGGLTTDEIARAFVVPEATIAQRIVRAKRTLSKARVPFEVPRGADRLERLSSVLDVVYLVFNEGYSATSGSDWVRPALCEEATRLGRVLAGLVPEEPEVHGLVALMELQSSRLRARVGPAGEAVRLLEQNRARWDQLLIRRGLAALDVASALADHPGPYQLQAAIAACHARARTAEETDWRLMTALYAALVALTGSPVVRLNHAVAASMAEGPEAGLALVDAVASDGGLATYPYTWSVRGYMLEKLGRPGEARIEFERAAGLTKNEREKALLLARAAACATT